MKIPRPDWNALAVAAFAIFAVAARASAQAPDPVPLDERRELAADHAANARYEILRLVEPLLGSVRVLCTATVDDLGKLTALNVVIVRPADSTSRFYGDVPKLVTALLPATKECQVVNAPGTFAGDSVEAPEWATMAAPEGDEDSDIKWGVGISDESAEDAVLNAGRMLAAQFELVVHMDGTHAGCVISDMAVVQSATRIGPRGTRYFVRVRAERNAAVKRVQENAERAFEELDRLLAAEMEKTPATPMPVPAPDETTRMFGLIEPMLDEFMRKRDEALLQKDAALISLADPAQAANFTPHATAALRNAYEAMTALNNAKLRSLAESGEVFPQLRAHDLDAVMRVINLLHNTPRGIEATAPEIKPAFDAAMASDAALFKRQMAADTVYAERMRGYFTRLQEGATRAVDELKAGAATDEGREDAFTRAYQICFDAQQLGYRLALVDRGTADVLVVAKLMDALDALPGSPRRTADKFRARRHFVDAARRAVE